MDSIRNNVFPEGRSNKLWAVRLTQALVVATGCFLGTLPAIAGTWDNAVTAHLAGDDATALRLSLELAREGDARAQGLAGFLYLYGSGVHEDRVQALKWYRLASEQGDAAAQSNLCAELLDDNATVADLDEALHWCRLSAAQGFDAGLFQLGVCYLLGRGVRQDLLEAYVWLSLAELRAHGPNIRSSAARLKTRAMKYLTADEIAEAERRIAPWKLAPP